MFFYLNLLKGNPLVLKHLIFERDPNRKITHNSHSEPIKQDNSRTNTQNPQNFNQVNICTEYNLMMLIRLLALPNENCCTGEMTVLKMQRRFVEIH